MFAPVGQHRRGFAFRVAPKKSADGWATSSSSGEGSKLPMPNPSTPKNIFAGRRCPLGVEAVRKRAQANAAQNCFLNCLLPTEVVSAIGFRIDEIETEILHAS
jgi:hypothetical protein